MQFTLAALIFTSSIIVTAISNPVVEFATEVHTAFTTICPNATQFIFGDVTYTATESATLTITNCPCTVVKPIYTTSSVHCDVCSAPTALASAPVSASTSASASASASTSASASASASVSVSANKTVVYPSSQITGATRTIALTPIVSPQTLVGLSGAKKTLAFCDASLVIILSIITYLILV